MDDRADVAQLTHASWQVLAGTSCMPRPADDLLSLLPGLAAERAGALDAEPFEVRPGLLAGEALVQARFTDPMVVAESAQVLSRLIDLAHDHDNDFHWRRLAGLLSVTSGAAKC